MSNHHILHGLPPSLLYDHQVFAPRRVSRFEHQVVSGGDCDHLCYLRHDLAISNHGCKRALLPREFHLGLGVEGRQPDHPAVSAPSTRRIASICTGAFALGEAGLLDGRRATTHWLFAKELQRRFPKASVEVDRIFIADGQVWTSAGMTAGLDMALGLVERDVGPEKAREAARTLVLHHRRAGGQSQHSTLLDLDAKSDRVQNALQYARRNLGRPLSVEELADAACLSPRQFSRVFRAETGLSPAKAIENLRLEAARLMLEQGRLPIETIAIETGFGDRERMRRSFVRTFGQTPRAIRTASHPLASF